MMIAAYILGGLFLLFVLFKFVFMPIYVAKNRPRLQHYIFAHKLLPHTVFENPTAVVMALMTTATDRAKPDGVELLSALWKDSEVEDPKDHVAWDPSQYEMTVLSHPNNTVIVIPLPPPQKRSEAYFVVIVFDGPGMAVGNIRQLRYFALEYVTMRGDKPATFLSEWCFEEGSDLEYKIHFEDLEPSVEVALQKIESLLPEKLPIG